MNFTAVIPARWQSVRFPGKPLVDLGGLPMVVRTARRVLQADTVGRAVVATDDDRILAACRNHEVEAVATSPDHENGTERVEEACRRVSAGEIVNVQGDEPLIDPVSIDALVAALVADGDALVANVVCPLRPEDLSDPNVVKAAGDLLGRMIYLSRSPIPHSWDKPMDRWRHLGRYAFRGDALARYVAREPGPLERAERIEMYRFIEYGDPIALARVPEAPPAVDVPADVAKVRDYAERRGGWD